MMTQQLGLVLVLLLTFCGRLPSSSVPQMKKTGDDANPCCKEVALADCWGFTAGEDSTASIQAAIDCPLAHTVVVRNMSGPWIVAPPYEPLLAIRAPETVSGRQRTFLDMSPLHTIFLGPALWRY